MTEGWFSPPSFRTEATFQVPCHLSDAGSRGGLLQKSVQVGCIFIVNVFVQIWEIFTSLLLVQKTFSVPDGPGIHP